MATASEGKEIAYASDEEVEAVIREFGNDPKAAIRALLHDLSIVIMDCEATVSHGYVRGAFYRHAGEKFQDEASK